MFSDLLFIKYLRTSQMESVKTYHMELTRAAPLCVRYLEAAFSLAENWDMTQVLILVLLETKQVYMFVLIMSLEWLNRRTFLSYNSFKISPDCFFKKIVYTF